MKKYLLVLDAASENLVVGIIENKKKLIFSYCNLCHQKCSEIVIEIIKKAFFEKGISMSDLDGVVITNGPGSYIGVRIILVIAKIFSFLLKIPIYTISFLRANSLFYEKNIVLLRARANYTYIAIFDDKNNLLQEDTWANKKVKKYIKDHSDFKVICLNENFLNLKKVVILKNVFLKNIFRLMPYFEKNDATSVKSF